MHLDKSARGGDSQSRFIVLEVGVGRIQLRLLGASAIRETAQEFFVGLNSAHPISGGHLFLPSAEKLFCCPARGFVLSFQDRTACHQHCCKQQRPRERAPLETQERGDNHKPLLYFRLLGNEDDDREK